MKQFDLSLWLKDKSRKVMTRLKKSVQIISIEGKEDIPIVALVEGIAHQYKPNGYHANVVACFNQCRDMGDYDLFFEDEEEKTIDDTEMNSLTYLTELGYTCIPPKEEQNAWSEEDERMLGKCIDAASGYYSLEDKQNIKDGNYIPVDTRFS